LRVKLLRPLAGAICVSVLVEVATAGIITHLSDVRDAWAPGADYRVSFEEFMHFIATSLKVEAGVSLTKSMLEGIAEKMLMILGTRTAERLVPIVGAVIGGTANYLFIKRMAISVKKMHNLVEPVVIEIS